MIVQRMMGLTIDAIARMCLVCGLTSFKRVFMRQQPMLTCVIHASAAYASMRFCHAMLFNVLQTYNADYQIPDSGGTATALFCGVKANAWTVGVNDNVRRSNCSNQAENTVDSVLQWAMDEGIFTSCPMLLTYFGHYSILPTRSKPSIREAWI